MPWKGTMAPKIALQHAKVVVTDIVYEKCGNCGKVVEIKAANMFWQMAATACSKQLTVNLAKLQDAAERRIYPS